MSPYRTQSPPPSDPIVTHVHRSYGGPLTLLVGVVAFMLGSMTNCIPREAREAMADGSYAAEHLRCVDKYDTKPKIDACRAGVRLRWGIAETVTVRDGGGQ